MESKDSDVHLEYKADSIITIINSINDGIVITDTKNDIVMINKSSALLRKNRYQDIFGKTIFELVSMGIILEPKVHEFKIIIDQIKLGITTTFEMKLKDNEQLFNVVGYPIYKGPDISRILYTSSDRNSRITEIISGHPKFEASSSRAILETRIIGDVGIFSDSDNMKPVIDLAQKVAVVDSPVFLTGESGVGKGVIAKYIHNFSQRAAKPFIQINCAAIPENLFESEVFGYEPGAFTGANRKGKLGLMELAQDGTLFLDEIGELSPVLQAKLLQVMQDDVFWRLGGSKPIQLRARVISATNQNIAQMIQNKRFREDLYYRICVVPIHIPPLRERCEDTILLAEGFINQFNEKYGTNKYFGADVRVWMNQYEWPGNVRELGNVIERMAIVSDGDEILISDIPGSMQKQMNDSDKGLNQKPSLKEANEKIESALINKVLNETKNSREAAAVLGVSQSTLLRKMHKYKLA